MLFLFFIFSFLFSFVPQPVEGVVAVVGNNIILQTDFVQQVQLEANKNNINPSDSPLRYSVLAEKVLNNLINQYVILEHAKKDTTLVVSSEEISFALDNQINNFISQVGSVEELERIFNKPIRNIRSDYWEEIENILYIDRLRYKLFGGVDVSRKEVLSFFNTYKDSLPPIPASASLSIIHLPLLPSEESAQRVWEKSNKIKNEIISKKYSFEEGVKMFSEDVGSLGSDGDLGFTLRGSLFENYEAAAYNLNVGEVGGPIKTPAGYHIIKLLNRSGEKIHSQHLLLTIVPSEKDISSSVKKINLIFEEHKDSPDSFDSLAVEYANLYKESFSGVYENSYYQEIFPQDISIAIDNSLEFNTLPPIALDVGGFCVISVLEKNSTGNISPETSWSFLYGLAKNKKTDDLLVAWINEAKKSVYIKVFQEN